VNPSFRKILVDHHISAVAIGVLLFWSLYWGLGSLRSPLVWAASFFFTAVAIRDIPYDSFSFNGGDRLMLESSLTFFFYAFICLAAAWLVSRWTYGIGPLRSLRECRARFIRENACLND
jgi:hypothetical protein